MAGKLRIVHLAVESLVPSARNARTHSEAQVAQIAASIEEFGWTNPVLVDGDGGIIAGHGRVLAAVLLGIPKVPCIELSHLSETQRRAYVIADNKLALNAGWDEHLLTAELIELEALDFDLALVGFDPDEIAALVAAQAASDGLTDPDAVPEAPETPVTVLGDLWALGRHRVLCGDATVATDVERALGGVEPHLMVTDPPWGVNYNPAWRNEAGASSDGSWQRQATGRVVTPTRTRAVGKVSNDDTADWRQAWALFTGDVAYVWHADLASWTVAESLLSSGFQIRGQIVWAKNQLVVSRGHYHFQHEPCWYAVRKGKTGHWLGDRKQSTLWTINHRKSETGHSTQKPVECMRRPIVNNSSPGQAVYDPFLGSGTTIIAAEMEGRHCLGLEIEPGYVDVIVKRWQEFVGKNATLEGDGRTFSEVSHERQKANPEPLKAGEGQPGKPPAKQERAKAGRRATASA